MSDHAHVLVFNASDPRRVADVLFARLIEADIVERNLTGCALGEAGHAPSRQAAKAAQDVESLLSLKVNGVQAEYPDGGQLYFSPDGGEPWVTCPTCRKTLELDRIFTKGLIRCSGCGGKWPLSEWTTHGCAFGTLAFFFWNWALRSDFIDNVVEWTGMPLVSLHYHL